MRYRKAKKKVNPVFKTAFAEATTVLLSPVNVETDDGIKITGCSVMLLSLTAESGNVLFIEYS